MDRFELDGSGMAAVRSLGEALGYSGAGLDAFVGGQSGSTGAATMEDLFASMPGMTREMAVAAAAGRDVAEAGGGYSWSRGGAAEAPQRPALHDVLDGLVFALRHHKGYTAEQAEKYARQEAELAIGRGIGGAELVTFLRQLALSIAADARTPAPVLSPAAAAIARGKRSGTQPVREGGRVVLR